MDFTLDYRWGDSATKHSPRTTIELLHAVVKFVGGQYGADLQRVTLAGFSRGAIAAWYVGLFDDGVAALWHSFVVYAHCDGEYPLGSSFDGDFSSNITQRLTRLSGRPSFVCNCDVKPEASDVDRLCPAPPSNACAGVRYSRLDTATRHSATTTTSGSSAPLRSGLSCGAGTEAW